MLHWHYEREDEYIHHIYVIIIIYDDKLDYKSLGMIGGPKSPDLSQIIWRYRVWSRLDSSLLWNLSVDVREIGGRNSN